MLKFDNTVHAVAGILQQGDKILVAERPQEKSYAGYWEFPGGKIEKDECGALALKRELYEELGVIVEMAHFLFDHHHIYSDKNVQLEIWSVLSFQGEPLGKEAQTLRWVTIQEISKLKLLEGNVAILDKLALVLGSV